MKKRTLIFRTGAVGDIIQTLPAVKKYGKTHPDEELTYMCGQSCAEALCGLPLIDSVQTFDDHAIYKGRITDRAQEVLGIISVFRRFDKCFMLNDSPIWKMLAVLSGVKELSFLENDSLTMMHKYMHCLNGTDSSDVEYCFQPADTNLEMTQPYIAISPGGGTNAKNSTKAKTWRGYQELISGLQSKVVLLGTAHDCDSISGDNIINLCGKTNLSDCYHIISRAELFIGNDSGLLHLAACTKTPKIGIFTATSPLKIFPASTDIHFLVSDAACAPCEKRGKYSKSCDHLCTDSPSIEDVRSCISKLHLSHILL